MLITVVCVTVEFLLGFALALLLVRSFRGRGLITVFFLLPMMVVPAVSGFIFFMIFQLNGPLNAVLSDSSASGRVQWLQTRRSPSGRDGVDIWQWTPLMFLIFLSGLAALPEDQMNAARILGAGFWHQLRYLVLPMMKAVILIAIIIRSIEAFKLFDAAYILTKGGPGEASTNISLYLFDETQVNTRWGYASSVAIIVMIMISIAGFYAIRPIERAQDESHGRAHRWVRGRPGHALARSHRGRHRGGGAGLMAAIETTGGYGKPPSVARARFKGVLRIGAVVLMAAFFAFPLYWAVTMSFKPQAEWNPHRRPGVLDAREPHARQLQGHPRPVRAGGDGLRHGAHARRADAAEELHRHRHARHGAGHGRRRAGGLRHREVPGRRAHAAVPDPAAADVPADRDHHPVALHVRGARAVEHRGSG